MKRTVQSYYAYCSAVWDGLMGQDITVRGLISSAETGDPLPNVQIELQGTPRKTSSDTQGFFEINVPRLISFMLVGMRSLSFRWLGHENHRGRRWP
ncbi:hypothetical protein D5R40_33035 [Okeania hirsuta]|uniref:Carboxypeptidase regulatory-like domain-containing protein n=1 Tax=Okeania hirsuta TaxID=1458930 RepID=A0A3N6NZ09_9CYAN|nr:hypothetical protein [Okeania hirsuta]RQH18184.1 hypothetical protein D5R40_33035 [Okeania hirsuta]